MSQSVYEDLPSNKILENVREYVRATREPQLDQPDIKTTEPNQHFRISDPFILSHQLKSLLEKKDFINTGWIESVQVFWASSETKLYLIKPSLKWNLNVSVNSKAVSVGFISGYFIVFSKDSIGMYTKEFKPVENTYYIPKGVHVTFIYKNVVGCDDGCLREVLVNVKKLHVEVSGSSNLFKHIFSYKNDDKHFIIDIIESSNFYVARNISSELYAYRKSDMTKLARVSGDIRNIIGMWTYKDDMIYVLDSSTYLYLIDIRDIRTIEINRYERVLPRYSFVKAVFRNGVFVIINSSPHYTDMVTFIRYKPVPLCLTVSSFGNVYEIGSTLDSILLLTTTGVYEIDEPIGCDELSQIAHFSSIIERVWDLPIREIIYQDDISIILSTYLNSNHDVLKTLSRFYARIVKTICYLDDNCKHIHSFKATFGSFFDNNSYLYRCINLLKLFINCTMYDNVVANDKISLLIDEIDTRPDVRSDEILNGIMQLYNSNCFEIKQKHLDFLRRYHYYQLFVDIVVKLLSLTLDNTLIKHFSDLYATEYYDKLVKDVKYSILMNLNPLLDEYVLHPDNCELHQLVFDATRAEKDIFLYFVEHLEKKLSPERIFNELKKYDLENMMSSLYTRYSVYYKAEAGFHKKAFEDLKYRLNSNVDKTYDEIYTQLDFLAKIQNQEILKELNLIRKTVDLLNELDSLSDGNVPYDYYSAVKYQNNVQFREPATFILISLIWNIDVSEQVLWSTFEFVSSLKNLFNLVKKYAIKTEEFEKCLIEYMMKKYDFEKVMDMNFSSRVLENYLLNSKRISNDNLIIMLDKYGRSLSPAFREAVSNFLTASVLDLCLNNSPEESRVLYGYKKKCNLLDSFTKDSFLDVR